MLFEVCIMMQFFSIVCAVRETCEPLGWGFRPFTYPNVRADLRQGYLRSHL
jgi:hypothetical protein